MPPVIRPATPDDITQITAIYAHAVLHGTATFEIDPPDAGEMARRWRMLTENGHPYLAAEINGVVAGYAYAGPYRSRPAYRWTVEDSIYIAPDAQRRGIGRALLQRLIDETTARDFRQMIAVIGDSAQAASIELHRALGFRLIGTHQAVGFKHRRWLDTVEMQRALGAGSSEPPTEIRSASPNEYSSSDNA